MCRHSPVRRVIMGTIAPQDGKVLGWPTRKRGAVGPPDATVGVTSRDLGVDLGAALTI